MVAVGEDHSPGPAAVGGVDQGSLASCIIRLIGADSGLTIATKRLADTILPNPILISFMVTVLSKLPYSTF